MFTKTISLTFALSLVLGLSSCTQTGGITKINGRSISTGEIDKVVTELMESANVTWLGLAVPNDNKVVYVKTYGLRNSASEALLNDSTIILGASFSKVVFGYVAMQLIQEGVLALDEPLYTYLEKPLPEYDEYQDLATDER